jgi:hypothetical protein
MRCATHSGVETNLTCGRCGTPICPKCLVQTPVGARCSKCAGLKRLPTYEIAPQQYLKAVAVGIGLAIAIGFVWGLLWRYVSFFNFLLAAGAGYAIGEVISLSVNRRRGLGLQVIGGSGVALSYMIAKLSPWGVVFSFYDLLVLAVGIFVAVSRLR